MASQTRQMEILANRIRELQESQTIKMAQMGRELKQKGVDIIDLSLGEPDFSTSAHIKEAAKRAIEEGYTHYPPVPGYPDLREAIARKFLKENNLAYTMDQIVVSTGAKQSLANVILCLVNPGDEVLMPAPYWVSYAAQIQLAEGKMVTVPTTVESEYKITPGQLEAHLNSRTKLFIFSSPCNPTGSVYSMAELEKLAEVFCKFPGVQIISDEIYEHINFRDHHESIAQVQEIADRVVVVNGFSKGFAMTGWRLGYIAAPLEIARACTKMQGQFTSGASSISQRAAFAAITEDLKPTIAMREAFRRRRDLMMKLLAEVKGLKLNRPEGAFYLFPDVSEYFGKKDRAGNRINDAEDLSMYLLKEAHVSSVTGAAFGSPQCLRLSYANSEDNLEKAAERIKNKLAELH